MVFFLSFHRCLAPDYGMPLPVPLLKLADVTKRYDAPGRPEPLTVLNGISLDISTGESLAIVGPSGSGKSTLLQIMGTLDRPTSGEYFLEDKSISMLDDNSLSDIRLKYIGFVFQSFNLMPQLSVQKNIELPLYYLGWEADKSTERAKELAANNHYQFQW